MKREEIKSFLPHREPMLLLDESALIDNGEKAIGIYNVRGNEWFLQGHYPDNPVVPGVILCEIMAQSCFILLKDNISGKTPYFTGIDKVRFKNMVFPGDSITVESYVTRQKGNFYFAHCCAAVNGKISAEGDLSFVLVEGK